MSQDIQDVDTRSEIQEALENLKKLAMNKYKNTYESREYIEWFCNRVVGIDKDNFDT